MDPGVNNEVDANEVAGYRVRVAFEEASEKCAIGHFEIHIRYWRSGGCRGEHQ
jgi:hypothetical protein